MLHRLQWPKTLLGHADHIAAQFPHQGISEPPIGIGAVTGADQHDIRRGCAKNIGVVACSAIDGRLHHGGDGFSTQPDARGQRGSGYKADQITGQRLGRGGRDRINQITPCNGAGCRDGLCDKICTLWCPMRVCRKKDRLCRRQKGRAGIDNRHAAPDKLGAEFHIQRLQRGPKSRIRPKVLVDVDLGGQRNHHQIRSCLRQPFADVRDGLHNVCQLRLRRRRAQLFGGKKPVRLPHHGALACLGQKGIAGRPDEAKGQTHMRQVFFVKTVQIGGKRP